MGNSSRACLLKRRFRTLMRVQGWNFRIEGVQEIVRACGRDLQWNEGVKF